MRKRRFSTSSVATKHNFQITVRLGNKSGVVTVDHGSRLTNTALTFCLNFTPEQRLYITIVGIKDSFTGKILPFVEEKNFSFCRVLSKEDTTKLVPGQVYDVLLEDRRKDEIKEISDEDKQEIRKKFDQIDVECKGFITFEQVRDHYKKEMERGIETSKRITSRKVEKDPAHKEKHEAEHEATRKFLKSSMESNIQFFMEMDVDNNGSVEWDEFLVYHYRQLKLKKRKISIDGSILSSSPK